MGEPPSPRLRPPHGWDVCFPSIQCLLCWRLRAKELGFFWKEKSIYEVVRASPTCPIQRWRPHPIHARGPSTINIVSSFGELGAVQGWVSPSSPSQWQTDNSNNALCGRGNPSPWWYRYWSRLAQSTLLGGKKKEITLVIFWLLLCTVSLQTAGFCFMIFFLFDLPTGGWGYRFVTVLRKFVRRCISFLFFLRKIYRI